MRSETADKIEEEEQKEQCLHPLVSYPMAGPRFPGHQLQLGRKMFRNPARALENLLLLTVPYTIIKSARENKLWRADYMLPCQEKIGRRGQLSWLWVPCPSSPPIAHQCFGTTPDRQMQIPDISCSALDRPPLLLFLIWKQIRRAVIRFSLKYFSALELS